MTRVSPSLLRVLVTLLVSVTAIIIFIVQNPTLGPYQSSDPTEVFLGEDNRAGGEETYSAILIDTKFPAEPHQYLDGCELNRLVSPNESRVARSTDLRGWRNLDRNHRVCPKPKYAAVINRTNPGIPIVLRKLLI